MSWKCNADTMWYGTDNRTEGERISFSVEGKEYRLPAVLVAAAAVVPAASPSRRPSAVRRPPRPPSRALPAPSRSLPTPPASLACAEVTSLGILIASSRDREILQYKSVGAIILPLLDAGVVPGADEHVDAGQEGRLQLLQEPAQLRRRLRFVHLPLEVVPPASLSKSVTPDKIADLSVENPGKEIGLLPFRGAPLAV